MSVMRAVRCIVWLSLGCTVAVSCGSIPRSSPVVEFRPVPEPPRVPPETVRHIKGPEHDSEEDYADDLKRLREYAEHFGWTVEYVGEGAVAVWVTGDRPFGRHDRIDLQHRAHSLKLIIVHTN